MDLLNAIGQAAEDHYLEHRALPTAPDGRYDDEAAPTTDDKERSHSWIYNLTKLVEHRIKTGPIISVDHKTLSGLADLIVNKDSIDDRKGAFSRGLGALSKLPPRLPLAKSLNDGAITHLYNNLGHPPSNYLGSANRFRDADGGNNNLLFPNVGRAGQPYARSVQGRHPLPSNTLPDPGVVFDALLKRTELEPKPHPGGNSSMTFAFAAIITHSLFRTNMRDQTLNMTSSYLDLSPLYGSNQEEQDSVRIKDGRGLLAPDAFAEIRLTFSPPAMSALLVLFNRNHNYIAENLLRINERKKWSQTPETLPIEEVDGKKVGPRMTQDDEIFNTARLVNCGHFMSIVFGDYVSGFLGLGRTGNSWSMDPFSPIKKDDGTYVGRGEGNHVSVEFNLLYRWHATLSQQDTKWTEEAVQATFGHSDYDKITTRDFGPAIVNIFEKIDKNPKTRLFHEYKRDKVTGKFFDADLAKILQDSTDSEASAFRARGTPHCLRPVEIMSMEQARAWNVCTMNEFRSFLGLKRFETFKEWNENTEIANAAEQLYGHIDNLELYPGIQAEDTMTLEEGSGFCAGYTLTRAILADAISLVRGDRFFTTEFTPANLTSWGFQDCTRDPNNGAFGAALPKLLFRHLPKYYPYNSTYGLFPFFTPAAMKTNLKRLKVASKYTFERPKEAPAPKVLTTMNAIRTVFGNSKMYKTVYESDMRFLIDGYGYFLVFEDGVHPEKEKELVMRALVPNVTALKAYADYYRNTTHKLILQNSFKIHGSKGYFIDIISQVINVVSVRWAAEKLCGIPLKTRDNPHAMYTEQQVYDMFAVLFSCVFRNVDPSVGWTLRNTAEEAGKILAEHIEKNLHEANPGILGYLGAGLKWITFQQTTNPSHEILARLGASKRPFKELSANILGLAVGSSINYAQACAQVVDFYLDDKYKKEREEIIALAQSAESGADAKIMGYIREAQRLEPQFAGLYRNVTADAEIQQGDTKIRVEPGDRIFASFKDAHLKSTVIGPSPKQVTDPVQGAGFVEQTLPQIVKTIFSLKNLRRAPGPQGHLESFTAKASDTTNHRIYVNNNGGLSPSPGSLLLQYGDDLPPLA